ncbi:MAG: hypothetical protein HZC36_02870 [Armatimonadetes bacterium]|nr:hypothetical protein [Armatimonadota bacterium]
MKLQWLLAIVLALAVSVGCKGKPSLVGDWTGSITVQTMQVGMDFHFDKDGTVKLTQDVMGRKSAQMGNYKESEKSFTFTATSMEAPDLPKAMVDKVNEGLKKDPKTVTFDIVWKDENSVEISQREATPPLDQKIALKRKS